MEPVMWKLVSDFRIPVLGTMAHSWVMSFDHEIDAFREYVKCYHENLILLADTYNVLEMRCTWTRSRFSMS